MKRVSPTDLDEEVEGNCFRASPFDWRIDIEEPVNNPVVSSGGAGAPIEIDVEEFGDSDKRSDSNDSESRKGIPVARSSRRKKKPKGLPKRPLSSYNIYFQSERSKIVREHEGHGSVSGDKLTFEELGKIIGKRWKALPESERKQYDKLADEEGERYRREMDAFNEAKRRRRAQTADLDRPIPLKHPVVSLDLGDKSKDMSANADGPRGPPPLSAYPLPPSTPVKARLPGSAASSPSAMKHVLSSDLMMPNLGCASDDSKAVIDGYAYAPSAASWQYHQAFCTLSSAFAESIQVLRATSQPQGPAPTTASAEPPPALLSQKLVPRPLVMSQSHSDPPQYLPVPPGMELFLPDSSGQERKYVVKYNFYSMTRREAEQYMMSLEVSAREAPAAMAPNANKERARPPDVPQAPPLPRAFRWLDESG